LVEFFSKPAVHGISIGLLTFSHLGSVTACSTDPGSRSLIENPELLSNFSDRPGKLQHLTDNLSTKLRRILDTSRHVTIASYSGSRPPRQTFPTPGFPAGRYRLQVSCGADDFTENRQDFIVDIVNTGIEPPEFPEGQHVALDQHRLTIDLANTIAPDDPRGSLYVRIHETGEPGEIDDPNETADLGEPRDLSEPGPRSETDWAISHRVQPPPADIGNVILVIDIPKDLHGPFTVSLGAFSEDNPTFNLQLE